MLVASAQWSATPNVPVVSASYTCAHGVTPGVATVVIPWVAGVFVGVSGTLTFSDGVNQPVRIRGCRVTDTTDTDLPGGGRGLILTIVDARHRWKYGTVSGTYNVIDRHPDPLAVPVGEFKTKGLYVPGTERTPQQLIALAMSKLSQPVVFNGAGAGERPAVDWRAENPARAAERVAEAVGCRLVYQPLADRVLIAQPGGFTRLDRRFPVVSEQPVFDTGDRPTHLAVECGDTLVTDYVKLRAVGWEADGRLRPIEELSYRPADNWFNYNPEWESEGWWHYVTKGDSASVVESQALAREFVWKLFVVDAVAVDKPLRGAKGKRGDGFQVPKFGKIKNRKAVTVSDRIILPEKNEHGQYVTKPARCFHNGVNWRKGRAGLFRNFTGVGDPMVPFTVDPDAGLVTFSRPMYRLREKDANGADVREPGRKKYDPLYGPPTPGRLQFQLADTYLQCALRVRDATTWQYARESISARIGTDPGGTIVEPLPRPDIQLVVEVKRAIDKMVRFGLADNAADVRRRAAAVLAAAAVRHRPRERLSRTYAGFLPIQPDGGIHSVTWSVDVGGPPVTRVGVSTETETYLPSFEERRKNERALDFLTNEWIHAVRPEQLQPLD